MSIRKARSIAIGICLILVVVQPVVVLGDESAAEAAEKAGRYVEALTQYASALRSTSPDSDAEYRLLERAASLTRRISPLPPLPDEAERRFIRAQAIVKGAKDREAFLRAADEFRMAVRAAPWLADAYFNLGVVLDKAEQHTAAMRALKLYVLAAPSEKDAKEAQRLIYEIEVRQEEAQRAKLKQAAQARAEIEQAALRQSALVATLSSGTWCEKVQWESYGARCASGGAGLATIRVNSAANQLNIDIDWHNGSASQIRATVMNLQLQGTFTSRVAGIGSYTSSLTGSVSHDGKRISISASSFGGSSVRQEYVRIN